MTLEKSKYFDGLSLADRSVAALVLHENQG